MEMAILHRVERLSSKNKHAHRFGVINIQTIGDKIAPNNISNQR